MSITLQQEMDMVYDQYVEYLLEKYGPAKYDYFTNENCKSKNINVTRSKEGLFCHHIDENKNILLSTPEIARKHPFSYQKADRLVYANYLEHLLLHIKIVEEDTDNRGLGLGGVIMISSTMNDYYRHKRASGWRLCAALHIKDRYADYIVLMKHFMQIAENKYGNILTPTHLAKGWHGTINQNVYNDLKE